MKKRFLKIQSTILILSIFGLLLTPISISERGGVHTSQASAQTAETIVSCAGLGIVTSIISSAANRLFGAIGGLLGGTVPVGDAGTNGKLRESNAKEFTLDSAAFCIANSIIEEISKSTVDWINNDFKTADGSKRPAFLQDFGKFMFGTDGVLDRQVGSFIEDEVPFLCGDFNTDIALRLTVKYREPFNTRTTCTFSEQLERAGKSYEQFSQRFSDGGGWQSWVEFTTVSHNNPYGAFFAAETELRARLDQTQLAEESRLEWGKGLLSHEVCDSSGIAAVQIKNPNDTGPPYVLWWQDLTTKELKGQVTDVNNPPCNPTTVTPGTVIENQLNKVLSSGNNRLEIADEFDEVVSALLVHLLKKLFDGSDEGLLGLSGYRPGSGGGSGNGYGFEDINELKSIINAQIRLENDYLRLLYAIRNIGNQFSYRAHLKGIFPSTTEIGPGFDRYSRLDINVSDLIDQMTNCEDPLEGDNLNIYENSVLNINGITSRIESRIAVQESRIATLESFRDGVEDTYSFSDISNVYNDYLLAMNGTHTQEDVDSLKQNLLDLLGSITDLIDIGTETACVEIPDNLPPVNDDPFVLLSSTRAQTYKAGDTITLDWTLKNVTECNASTFPGNTFWSGEIESDEFGATSYGSRNITLLSDKTQTFDLTCLEIKENDDIASTPVEVKSTVEIKLTPPVVFESNVSEVESSDIPVVLSWNLLSVETCVATSEPSIIGWDRSLKSSADGLHTEVMQLNRIYTTTDTQRFTLTCQENGSGNTLAETVDVYIKLNDCEATCEAGGGGRNLITPAINVGSSGENTTESGGSTNFLVSLTTEPTSSVTIPVSSSDETEGVASLNQIILNSGNWSTGVLVTVTGVDDNPPVIDENTQYRIALGTSVSDDEAYNGLDPNDVIIVNEDNDNSGSGDGGGDGPPKGDGGL